MTARRVRLPILMLVVAVVAMVILIGRVTARLWALSGNYRQRADEHSQFETMHRSFAAASAKEAEYWAEEWESLRAAPLGGSQPGLFFTLKDLLESSQREQEHVDQELADVKKRVRTERANAARELAKAKHYARLRAKYDRAARCPWLRIAPDPLLPE